MKKYLVFVTITVICLSFILVSCNKPPIETPPEYGWNVPDYETNGVINNDVDGKDLFISAVDYIKNADNYYHQFVTTGEPTSLFGKEVNMNLGTQTRHEIRELKNGNFYRQEVCYGTIAAKTNKMERYYFDGTANKGYYVENPSFTKNVQDVFSPDFSGVEYKEIALTDAKQFNERYMALGLYVINEDTVIDCSNVYSFNDKLYCKITVSCDEQPVVVDEILTELESKSIEFEEDSYYIVEFTDINGQYLLTAYQLHEMYVGEKNILGGIKAGVHQTLTGTITY